jgi:hypothetical protein
MQRLPTLLNSCASAATAAEASFRIDYPETQHRAARVIALDERAAELVRRLATAHWSGGHFLVFEAAAGADGPDGSDGHANGGAPAPVADATLRRADGTAVLLSSELADADSAVMIATAQASASAASVIGDACAARRIMSAGLVISGSTGNGDVDDVVAALRPNAMVLVILKDHHDVPEILSALRV